MDSHPPLNPRPPTAAPGRRNLMSVTAALPAVTAASEAATAAPPPGMIRLNKSVLSELQMHGLRAIQQLSKKRRSDQPPKQLSPIDRISPPPRLQEIEKARQTVRERIKANRYNRENDRAALLESLNSEPYMTQQGDVQVIMPQCRRPETVRSARLRSESHGEVGAVLGRYWMGFQKSNELKNIGRLGGGKSRKNVGRRTVKRKRRLTRNKHRRANIRGDRIENKV